jgi:peptide deformylase
LTVLKVTEWPARVLETKSKEVTDFGQDFKQFVKDMQETMLAAGGIGLAANQLNVLKRVFVIEIPYHEESELRDGGEEKQWWHNKPFVFVNPKITKLEGKMKNQEGCLSFPDIYDYVERAEEIWIEAQDENGKSFEVQAKGLLAICIQHEFDHIEGIVFINRMSRLKSALIKKKLLQRAHMTMEI